MHPHGEAVVQAPPARSSAVEPQVRADRRTMFTALLRAWRGQGSRACRGQRGKRGGRCMDKTRLSELSVSASLGLRFVPPRVRAATVASWRNARLAGTICGCTRPWNQKQLCAADGRRSGG